MHEAMAEELKCPICLELLDDPVLLACAHFVCRQCAAQQIEFGRAASPPDGAVPVFLCPLCREPTPIPTGVASLRRNPYLCNVVGQLRRRWPSPAEVTTPTCGQCQKALASYGCQSCKLALCIPCQEEHHVGELAHHSLTDIDTFQKTLRMKMACEEHHKKRKFYCPRCRKVVCSMCVMFGRHKDHGCKQMEEAWECVPRVKQMEEALQAVDREVGRLEFMLKEAQLEVQEDGQDSEANCKKLFEAFLLAVRDNTQQRLAFLTQQQATVQEWQQRVTELAAKVPGARGEICERVELHCQLTAFLAEVQALEVTTPPPLKLGKEGTGTPQDSRVPTPNVVLPALPAPTTGARHRCLPAGLYGVPEFQPDPPIPGLAYSHHNRRCTAGDFDGRVSGVAKEGFTGGQQQFTVHVINPRNYLYIGVVTADAPRKGAILYHAGLFLCHDGGSISSLNSFKQPFTTDKVFPAGSRVTMRLDFDRGTASYEVDGRDLGPVPCPLPKGPLYPAVLFYNSDEEVEFVPSPAS